MKYAAKVQTEIRSALAIGRSVGSKDIASRVGLSLRTLQRRLSEESTTFGDILDEVRKGMCADLLKTDSVEATAKTLGFAHRNCLLVAYKRWFGTTPRRGKKVTYAPS